MTRGRIYRDDHLATAGREELAAWLAVQRAHLTAQLTGHDERTVCEKAITEDCLDHDREHMQDLGRLLGLIESDNNE